MFHIWIFDESKMFYHWNIGILLISKIEKMRFSWNSERVEIKWTFGCGIDSSRYMRKFSKWQDKKILVKYFIWDHQKIRFWKWVTIDSNIKIVKNRKWPLRWNWPLSLNLTAGRFVSCACSMLAPRRTVRHMWSVFF